MRAQPIGRRLVESAPRPRRGATPLLASVFAHGGFIAVAVWSTLDPRLAVTRTPAERVAMLELAAVAPPRETTPASPRQRATARGFQILSAPAEIPLAIPNVDLTRPATLAEDFSGRGALGGIAGGIGVAPLAPASSGLGEPIDGTIADQQPYLLPGQMGPAYPDPLRFDAPDGLVVVRFVIDTLGRVERPSLQLIEATHPLFAASVRAALDRLHYLPASLSGRRIRVRMEQRFEFHLATR